MKISQLKRQKRTLDFWSKFKKKVSSVGDFAKDLLEKGKNAINNLIDAVATLIITSCVIPIFNIDILYLAYKNNI